MTLQPLGRTKPPWGHSLRELISWVIVLPFGLSLATKLINFSAAVGEVEVLTPLRPAPVFTVGVIVWEAIGLARYVLGGDARRPGALILAAFTVAASLLAHDFWARGGTEWLTQLRLFTANLALTGALLLVAMTNPLKTRSDNVRL